MSRPYSALANAAVVPADHVAGVLRIRRPYHADLSSLRRLGVMAVAAPVLEQLTLAVAGFVVFVTGMIAVAAHHGPLPSHIAVETKSPRVKSWGLFVGARRGAWPLPPAKAISRPVVSREGVCARTGRCRHSP